MTGQAGAVTQAFPATRPGSRAVRPPRSPVDYWGRVFVVLNVVCWGASFVIGFKAALALLTIVGFAAAFVGVFRPVIGLLGIGMLCTLDPLTNSLLFGGGLLRWNTFNYWLVLVAVVFGRMLIGRSDFQNRMLQLFAILLSLEILVSLDWYRGLQDVAGVVAAFGLVVYFVRASREAAAWYWLGLVCGTTAAAGGVAFFVQQASLPHINTNAWAFLPLTALFAICLAFALAPLQRRAAGVLAVLASANYNLVFLSGSRGTLLTASGCGLFLLVLTRRMRHRWLALLSAVLVALPITMQFSDLQARALQRIHLLLDPHQSLSGRTSGRSVLLESGWNLFAEHPLGIGTGGFSVARVNLNVATGQLAGWRAQEEKAAHAGWIKILAENGLPGFLLMAAFVLSFTVAGWRSRDRDLFMLGLLVTLSFGLGFASTEYASKGLWFLAAGAMAIFGRGSVFTRDVV